MIKAVIFDMDGVIVDSEPLWWKSVDIQLAKHKIDVGKKDKYQKYVDLHIRGRGQKEAIKAHKIKFGLKGTYRFLLEERLNILIKMFQTELKAVPGTIPFIKKLHKNKFPLVLASSSPPRVINYVLRKYGLKKYFSHIVSGENLKHSKPHPEIFLKAAAKLKEKPENIIVIEDSKSGAVAAKKAGMKCIGLKQYYTPYKYLKTTDLITKNLNKIPINKLKNL